MDDFLIVYLVANWLDNRSKRGRRSCGSWTGSLHRITSIQCPSDSAREHAKDFECGEVEEIASIVVLPGHAESDEAEAAAWDGADREVVGHKSVAH